MVTALNDEEVARSARALERRARMLSGAALDPETPEARIELMFELTRAAWVMTGLPWAPIPRAQWPGRVRNLGEAA